MRTSILIALLLAAAMLAVVGCDREITGEVKDNGGIVASNNCFDCHNGADALGADVIMAVRQWDVSQHASGDNINRNTGACRDCHISEGFIERITGQSLNTDASNAIGCFACHNPHENGDFRLRTAAAVVLGNGTTFDRNNANLCASCHHGRQNVDTYVADGTKLSTHYGPHHGPQSDMLIGTNAYEYAGYDYVDSWHATGVTDGCVKCHMDVSVGYAMGGHTWWMESEEFGENIGACNVDGCHVTGNEIEDFNRVTAYDFDEDGDTSEGVQTEITDLLDELESALESAGLVEYDAEAGLYEPTNGLTVSDADSVGAVFNYLFVREDRSMGIHNTRYAAGLLISSINYLATGNPSKGPASLASAH